MKKLLSVFLAAIMLITLAAPTFAASEDKALRAAMTVVKQRFEIGEEYTEFDYYSGSNYFGKTTLSMTWSTEDSNKFIRATVCGKVITNYSIERDYSSGEARLGDMSKAELVKSAKAFIKKANPSLASRLVIDEDSFSANIYNRYVTLRFHRVANGITVSDNGGYMNLDKDTGETVSFRMNWTQGSGFAKPSNAISLTKAMTQISKLYQLEPSYVLEYDWETNTRSARLVYNTTVSGDIDAFTGKLSTFEESYQEYENEDDFVADAATIEEDMADSKNGVSFNEKELAAIEKNEKFLTEEKVMEIIKNDKYINLTDDFYLSYSSLYQDSYEPEKFTYYLNFSNESGDNFDYNNYRSIVVRMNAETGEIYSFYQFSDNGSSYNFDEAKADKIAEDVVKTYIGDKAGEYVLTSVYTNNYYEFKGVTSRNYSYTRMVNGVKAPFDDINIEINYDYTVTSFSYEYTNIEFPSAEMLTPEKAFTQLFTQLQPELMYKINVNDKTKVVKSALVYEMPYFSLDAKTGELYNNYWYYNYDENELPEYTDLSGDIKPIAQRLEEYGIVLKDADGKLNADQPITVADFLTLTSCIGNNYYYPIYSEEITEDVAIDDFVSNEIDEKAAQFITRASAAAAIISSIYGSQVAEIKGIFKSPYSDVSETNEYVGYIAIAAATGIMTGKNGKFSPDATLTRGDALRIIYTYLDK